MLKENNNNWFKFGPWKSECMAPPKRRLHSERNMADERVGQSSRKRLVNEIAKKLGREPGEDWKMIL